MIQIINDYFDKLDELITCSNEEEIIFNKTCDFVLLMLVGSNVLNTLNVL